MECSGREEPERKKEEKLNDEQGVRKAKFSQYLTN
jgi:hypothetical protein